MLRQSQFERRIAVELLHARHEKDVIKENCIIKQREIEEKRTKEFIQALDRERVNTIELMLNNVQNGGIYFVMSTRN
jgi:hypothetical protein